MKRRNTSAMRAIRSGAEWVSAIKVPADARIKPKGSKAYHMPKVSTTWLGDLLGVGEFFVRALHWTMTLAKTFIPWVNSNVCSNIPLLY